jgi:hypothetical protein
MFPDPQNPTGAGEDRLPEKIKDASKVRDSLG